DSELFSPGVISRSLLGVAEHGRDIDHDAPRSMRVGGRVGPDTCDRSAQNPDLADSESRLGTFQVIDDRFRGFSIDSIEEHHSVCSHWMEVRIFGRINLW